MLSTNIQTVFIMIKPDNYKIINMITFQLHIQIGMWGLDCEVACYDVKLLTGYYHYHHKLSQSNSALQLMFKHISPDVKYFHAASTLQNIQHIDHTTLATVAADQGSYM